MDHKQELQKVLEELELTNHGEIPGSYDGEWFASGEAFNSISPTDGSTICKVKAASKADYDRITASMLKVKPLWQNVPAPKRGEVVREIGQMMRAKKEALGALISLEMGKIREEALGEVQEFIDICDYAVGLSRNLNGLIIPSEREQHVIWEQWHPLGLVGIITAFNFPCAVYGWNVAISMVCGNVNLWKPATSTALIAIATNKIVAAALRKHGYPGAVCSSIIGSGRAIGELLIQDRRLALISFTGSTAIGTRIATAVHSRFGRTILELGGNNAIIVMNDANLDMALISTLFAAVGTCGQRCTSVRRLLLHESIYDSFLGRLLGAYKSLKLGNPLDKDTLVGPLHTAAAVEEYRKGLEQIKAEGGVVRFGGNVLSSMKGFFVEPTLVEIKHEAPIVKTELFCPILHVIKFKNIDEAIEINNEVPQGLSSSLFTNDQRNIFKWTSHAGSDCGLVNVNVPTNGAEIGGAFGGEKETGSGRESGSDSWKQYMRRATCTINYGNALPLAQGINFGAKPSEVKEL